MRLWFKILVEYQIPTCSSLRTVTLVGINQVNAASSVLARVAVALLDLDITDGARISRIAFTGEGGNAIFTHTMVAWRRNTVIDVLLTKQTSEAWNNNQHHGSSNDYSLRHCSKSFSVIFFYLQNIRNHIHLVCRYTWPHLNKVCWNTHLCLLGTFHHWSLQTEQNDDHSNKTLMYSPTMSQLNHWGWTQSYQKNI